MNYSRKSRNATQTQHFFTVLLVLDLSECLNIRSTFVEKEKKDLIFVFNLLEVFLSHLLPVACNQAC